MYRCHFIGSIKRIKHSRPNPILLYLLKKAVSITINQNKRGQNEQRRKLMSNRIDTVTNCPGVNVIIYTDGACSENPGPGGCAAIITAGPERFELVRSYRFTTNNRMELMAVILALQDVNEGSKVTVYTDSKYIADAFNAGWLENWKNNGWRTGSKKTVKNQDLWQRLDKLSSSFDVTFNWIQGHAEDPENQRCDQLAVNASLQGGVEIDVGYEEGCAA